MEFFGFHHTLCCFAVGDSKPNGQEDISPYATFHLLGMREEAKNNGMVANAANFQTMPHGPQQPAQQQVNNPSMAPTTPRHMSQTMNVSLFLLIFYFSIEKKKSLAITQKGNHKHVCIFQFPIIAQEFVRCGSPPLLIFDPYSPAMFSNKGFSSSKSSLRHLEQQLCPECQGLQPPPDFSSPQPKVTTYFVK